MPVANVVGSQRRMTAIPKGLIATMPLIIVGSFFTILLTIPSESIAAWMSTNWSVSAAILVMVNFLITLAIYYPFFKVFEKQQIEKELAEKESV